MVMTLQDVMITFITLLVVLSMYNINGSKINNFNKLSITYNRALINNNIILRSNVLFVPIGMYDSSTKTSQYQLGAVPKKKPSHRRTRIRRVAWMKKNPITKSLPTMVDMADMLTYTSGTYTKARTTRQNWLNLPNTRLTDGHFMATELPPPL